MDIVQFHIALSIYNEFLSDDVSGFEWFRDCAGSVHFVAVHDGSVLEATLYMDEPSFELFAEHVDDEDDEEAEEEATDEEESSDEEYEPDEDAGPAKRRRCD